MGGSTHAQLFNHCAAIPAMPLLINTRCIFSARTFSLRSFKRTRCRRHGSQHESDSNDVPTAAGLRFPGGTHTAPEFTQFVKNDRQRAPVKTGIRNQDSNRSNLDQPPRPPLNLHYDHAIQACQTVFAPLLRPLRTQRCVQATGASQHTAASRKRVLQTENSIGRRFQISGQKRRTETQCNTISNPSSVAADTRRGT